MKILACTSLVLLLGTAGFSAEDPTGSLTVLVKVRGAESGRIELALVDSQAAFEDEEPPVRTGQVTLTKGSSASWEIDDVPYGVYAVKAYLDRDDSGALERNLFGAPTEPYGFSNDARGRFGPPGWEDASFEVKRPETGIAIKLK